MVKEMRRWIYNVLVKNYKNKNLQKFIVSNFVSLVFFALIIPWRDEYESEVSFLGNNLYNF